MTDKESRTSTIVVCIVVLVVWFISIFTGCVLGKAKVASDNKGVEINKPTTETVSAETNPTVTQGAGSRSWVFNVGGPVAGGGATLLLLALPLLRLSAAKDRLCRALTEVCIAIERADKQKDGPQAIKNNIQYATGSTPVGHTIHKYAKLAEAKVRNGRFT